MPPRSPEAAGAGAEGGPAPHGGLLLGRVRGVPVQLSGSWFLFALVITVAFAPRVGSLVSPAATYAVAFGYAVLLLLSVLAHEVGHAVVARAAGMRVTGITLNVWGGHTSFADETPGPGRSFLVAVAGPVANALLAVAAWALLGTLEPFTVTALLVRALLVANVLVAAFNLLPGLPLDGGHLLEALVWRVSGDRLTGTTVAAWGGRVVAAGILVAAVALPLAAGGRPELFSVVWAGIFSALLWHWAGEALRSARARRRPPVSAGQLLRPAIAVPVGATVADVVDRAPAAGRPPEIVLVTDDGVPVAVVDGAALQRVPVERRRGLRVGATARALGPRPVLRAETSGQALLEAVTHFGLGEHVVVDASGAVIGLLRGEDVLTALGAR
ncbi:hypothetical protein NUM3379_02480 [Kineococcus sp. NUM-3379]